MDKEEDRKFKATCLIYLVGLVWSWFCMGFGFLAGHSITEKKMEREAIKRGLAHYEVDPEGHVTFVWKEK